METGQCRSEVRSGVLYAGPWRTPEPLRGCELMDSKTRARTAMSGGTPDRVPVIPQICPPHSITVSGLPFRETLVDRLKNPRKYDLFEAECAVNYGVDGVRVWAGGGPMDVEWEGGYCYEVDGATGERTGIVDFMGGGGPILLPPKRRQITEEDVEAIPVVPADELLGSQALAPMEKVVEKFGDELFIIGVPGMFTVETMYHTQDMEQTLMDIVLRPELIKRHTEKLLEQSIQTAVAMANKGTAEYWFDAHTYAMVAASLPDALSGGAVGLGPVLLCSKTSFPSVTRGWIEGKVAAHDLTRCLVLGGTPSISAATKSRIDEAAR